jgi:hypothetical protein
MRDRNWKENLTGTNNHMKIINKTVLAVLFAAGMALNANALLLTPATATWQGSVPNNPDADVIESITGTSAQLTLAYKDNVGGSEEGSFASSYKTTYYNTPTDPQDAEIKYTTGGAVISGSPIYLLVKDGNQTPIWYIFDISSWNGTEKIQLKTFWPAQGAISHVGIYTGTRTTTTVPDAGSTVALLGLALTSIGFLRRKLAS